MAQDDLHFGVPARLALVTNAERKSLASRPSKRLPLVILTLAIIALGVAASSLIDSTFHRAAIGIVALGSAVAAAIKAWASSRSRPKAAQAPTYLVVNTESLSLARPDCAPEHLVSLTLGFGFTLLTTADHSRLVVAMTSGNGLFCIGCDVGPVDLRRFDLLLPHAVTVCREDLSMATHSPRGDNLLVDSVSLLRLIDILIQSDATSLGRLILTDSHGQEVLLDRDRLTTPRGTIRLDQPFEWRGLRFREGRSNAEFQGTWIRQGIQEFVLVSLPIGDVRGSIHDMKTTDDGLAAMLRQDVRLADGPRCHPPPLEQRIAVDRLFILPLRRALDGARFERRDSIPGGASLGDG